MFSVGYAKTFAVKITCLLLFFSQKNSPFQEEVNVYLRRLDEMGLIKKWISGFFINTDRCDTTSKIIDSHERDIVSLRLKEASTFFVILAIGHGIAGMVFLAELLLKFFQKGRGNSGDETEMKTYRVEQKNWRKVQRIEPELTDIA